MANRCRARLARVNSFTAATSESRPGPASTTGRLLSATADRLGVVRSHGELPSCPDEQITDRRAEGCGLHRARRSGRNRTPSAHAWMRVMLASTSQFAGRSVRNAGVRLAGAPAARLSRGAQPDVSAPPRPASAVLRPPEPWRHSGRDAARPRRASGPGPRPEGPSSGFADSSSFTVWPTARSTAASRSASQVGKWAYTVTRETPAWAATAERVACPCSSSSSSAASRIASMLRGRFPGGSWQLGGQSYQCTATRTPAAGRTTGAANAAMSASPGSDRGPRRRTRAGSRPRSPSSTATATAEKTATPSAAPISCAVVIRPDASPACSSAMSLMAVMAAAGSTRPVPAPMTSRPGSSPVR